MQTKTDMKEHCALILKRFDRINSPAQTIKQKIKSLILQFKKNKSENQA